MGPISPEVKRPKREADYIVRSYAAVKDEWS